jgi:large subunit ribosomal protein L21
MIKNKRMYAIVNIAGQQFKVQKDQKLFVHRLEDKEGDTVRFDEVLLIDNDKNVLIGEPTIKGAIITGKVLSHPKGDKVLVFKKKRRKGYKVLNGHRQYLTEIQIQEIVEKGATKAEAKPETTAQKTTSKAETVSEKTDTTTKIASTEKKATPAAKKSTSTTAKKPAVAKKPTVAKKITGTKAATEKPAADNKVEE